MNWEVPAKVNWTLRVLGKRSDGFHELRSWFVALDLCDRLSAEPVQGDESSLVIEGADDLPVADNLVLRAERAWRAAGGRAPAMRWTLHKSIPAAAGLGGGSSDAAGALCALEAAASLPLGLRDATAVAAAVGSDVPFFFAGEEAEYRGGRGEVWLAREPAPVRAVVLAVPAVPVPTPAVYGALEAPAFAGSSAEGFETLPPAPGANDLASAAYRAVPALAAFRDSLAGVAEFHLSGSGGTHYAAFESDAAAQQCSEELRARSIQTIVTRTRAGSAVREVQCR